MVGTRFRIGHRDDSAGWIALRRGVKKCGYFTVRLTESVYRRPPYGRLFVKIIFDVFFILDYDFMWSETDFTQEIFMQLWESPIPPLTAAALQMIICKRPAPFG